MKSKLQKILSLKIHRGYFLGAADKRLLSNRQFCPFLPFTQCMAILGSVFKSRNFRP